jgi:hypothetical protein
MNQYRQPDGSEELYDHQNDLNEWHNLAAKPEYGQLMDDLAKHFPAVDSTSRRNARP